MNVFEEINYGIKFKEVTIVRLLQNKGYHNCVFVLEEIDGRFGNEEG